MQDYIGQFNELLGEMELREVPLDAETKAYQQQGGQYIATYGPKEPVEKSRTPKGRKKNTLRNTALMSTSRQKYKKTQRAHTYCTWETTEKEATWPHSKWRS